MAGMPEITEGHERTASQQALYEHRNALDLRDPMITKWGVEARDSPSSRYDDGKYIYNTEHETSRKNTHERFICFDP